MSHSYTNPSERQDLSHLEAGVGEGEYVDKHGFTVKPPITDRECIYKCLDNCRHLAGLDRKQVSRLCDEFAVERTKEELQREYPPL
tara:strand:- start:109 stop:366 length:258 start_codon:yes stop_codon:yes gene_type:complete